MEYVLGFAFSDDRKSVLLVKKEHGPEINIGKLNGIGGKIEDGETAQEAMGREFREETGGYALWVRVGEVEGDDWIVHVFKGEYQGNPVKKTNDVGEELEWNTVGTVQDPYWKKYYAQNVQTMVAHAITGDGLIKIKCHPGLPKFPKEERKWFEGGMK